MGCPKPLSSALIQQGRTVLAIDILLHSSMNIFYRMSSLSSCFDCVEQVWLPIAPLHQIVDCILSYVFVWGGPRALRTPDQLNGIEGLSASEAMQLQESSILFDRCAECACITHTAGGHAHIEQPSGAMSWREPMAQRWMLQSSCNLVLVAACAYGMDIYKNWLFATSFQELSRYCIHVQSSSRYTYFYRRL